MKHTSGDGARRNQQSRLVYYRYHMLLFFDRAHSRFGAHAATDYVVSYARDRSYHLQHSPRIRNNLQQYVGGTYYLLCTQCTSITIVHQVRIILSYVILIVVETGCLCFLLTIPLQYTQSIARARLFRVQK